MTETMAGPPRTLVARYGPEDLSLLEPGARARFGDRSLSDVAWELLYRKEPDLYDRLIAGEHIHPKVIDALPRRKRCVEIAAGTGRLTASLVERCDSVVAVEPAAPLREMLAVRLPSVEVRSGYFDDTGLPDDCADLVVSCSAFTATDAHGGEPGLRELERIAAPGATIALVWPADVDWLAERGFAYESYDGQMCVDFGTLDEAVELASIFYPDAVEEIARRGEARVPYEILGMNPPRDIAWKTL